MATAGLASNSSPSSSAGAGPSGARLSALTRYAEISLFLLLANGILALVWTGKMDPIAMVLAPAAMLFKAVRYWQRRGPELSPRTATWLVVAYVPFYPLDLLIFSRAYVAGAPNAALYAALQASIHLMLYVLVVRLLSATKTRDQLFLAMMATSALLAAAIFTVDTAFVIFLLAYLVLSVSTFMAIEMRRSAEGAVTPPLESGTPAAARLGRALAITALGLTAGAALAGAAIFVILPRFPAGYLSGLNFSPTLIAGFSDNVELGRIGEIKLNPTVVMRTKTSVSPEGARYMRWRGIVLTTFDGHRWFTERREKPIAIPADSAGWCLVGSAMPSFDPLKFRPVRYSVLLEPVATDALFVLPQPISVRGGFQPGSERSPRDSRGYVLKDETDSLSIPYNNFSKMYYEGESLLPALQPDALRAAGRNYPPDVLEKYLQLPNLDDRIPKLAREITGHAPTPYDQAAEIEIYLRTRFGYTLQQPDPAPADPLAHFLFRRQAGHCEYFATAMTVLARSLGIPARYVNGFLPGEYNDVGDSYIVRGSDAHSWVEIYFPGYGWVPFDPTPPAGQKPRFFLGRLAYYWDWFELTWNEWVINYNAYQQFHLAANATRATREWGNRARDYLILNYRRAVDWLKHLHLAARGAIRRQPGLLLGMALIFSLFLLALLRGRVLMEMFSEFTLRSGLARGPAAEAAPRVATIYYSRLLRLLERRGLTKTEAQTPLEFVAAVPAGALAAQVARMTDLYHAARFGASQGDLRELARQLGEIRATLRTAR